MRRSALWARMRSCVGWPDRYEAFANDVRIGGTSLVDLAPSAYGVESTYSEMAPACRRMPCTSTTNTTALAFLMYFFASSRSLGCPGRSTSRIGFVPYSVEREKVVTEDVMEVCVGIRALCTSWGGQLLSPVSIQRACWRAIYLREQSGFPSI